MPMPYNETIQFTFKGRDQLSGPTNNAQRKMDALGGSMKRTHGAALMMGAALGGAVAVGLVGFIAALGNGFRDAQTFSMLLRQTEGVIKTTGGAANVSAPHVKKLAAELESMSAVDENLIINSENVMLTFRMIRNEVGKGNNIFDQATTAALNLSIAMHEDLQTATVQVGKALNDPIQGMNNLRRIGVSFTDDQQKLIAALWKSGHRLEAQKMILKELNMEFGKSIAASGGGLPGALFRLKDAITDAFRDLMLKYEPALARFVNWLAQRIPGAVQSLIGFLGKLGNFVANNVAPRLVKAFKEFGPEIAAGFFIARDKVIEIWQKFSPRLAKILGQARDRAVDLWKEYAPKIATILGQARDKAITLWDQYGPEVTSRLATAKVDIEKAITGIKGLPWDKIIGKAKDIGAKVAVILVDVGKQINKTAQEWGPKILDGVRIGLDKGDWAPLGRTLGDGLSTALKNLGSVASKIQDAVGKWFSSVDWYEVGVKIAKVAVPFAVGFLTEFFGAVIEYAVTHPMNTLKLVAGFIPLAKFARAFGPLRTVIEKLPFGKWVSDHVLASGAFVFDKVKQFVGFIGKGIFTGFKEEFPKIGNFLESFFNGDMSKTLDGAKNVVFHKMEDIISAVAIGIGRYGSRAFKALGDFAKLLNRPFLGIEKWFLEKGQLIVRKLVEGIRSLIRNVRSGIGDVIDKVTSPFKTAGTWLLRRGAELISGLLRGAGPWINRTAQQIRAFISDRLLAPFRAAGGWLVNRGAQLISGLWRGAGPWISRVGNNIWSFINSKLLAPFRGAFGWLVSAGGRIIRGLFSGITTAVSNARTWVRDHITGPIIKAVRDFFGIKSPSTVMMGIGKHLVGGLILGMLKHDLPGFITSHLGGMPSLLGALVQKGVFAIAQLPAKAMNALSKLGGFLGGMLGGGMMPDGKGYGNVKPVGSFPAVVARWAPLVLAGLRANGLSPMLLTRVLTQLKSESYGNPNAINLWDSNFYRGTPSKGLMQVIDPTFRANHFPGTSWNIYDPQANIFAALRYAKGRYGPSLGFLGQGHGYDTGGLARGAGWWQKGPRAERVLSPRQTIAFERWLSVGPEMATGGGRRGGVHIHLSAPNYIGSRDELMGELYRLARQGRLRQVVTMATK